VGEACWLGAELAQVVVEVFVHAAAPFLRREFSEKGMGMTGALGFSAFVKLADFGTELLLFALKIAGAGENEFFGGGTVLGEGFLVDEDGLDERSDKTADENAREIAFARGHVHRGGAVGQHLGNVHFAPLAGGGGLEFVDAGENFVDGLAIKEVFHGRPVEEL
jgi:hypothetical protein